MVKDTGQLISFLNTLAVSKTRFGSEIIFSNSKQIVKIASHWIYMKQEIKQPPCGILSGLRDNIVCELIEQKELALINVQMSLCGNSP
jgi:hypothetical protein